MTLAELGWPAALVWSTTIVSVALVVTVLVWSVFRTGQTAIRHDRESLRGEGR
jgi:hypothetical protein